MPLPDWHAGLVLKAGAAAAADCPGIRGPEAGGPAARGGRRLHVDRVLRRVGRVRVVDAGIRFVPPGRHRVLHLGVAVARHLLVTVAIPLRGGAVEPAIGVAAALVTHVRPVRNEPPSQLLVHDGLEPSGRRPRGGLPSRGAVAEVIQERRHLTRRAGRVGLGLGLEPPRREAGRGRPLEVGPQLGDLRNRPREHDVAASPRAQGRAPHRERRSRRAPRRTCRAPFRPSESRLRPARSAKTTTSSPTVYSGRPARW